MRYIAGAGEKAGVIEIHLPEKLHAHATISSASIAVDDLLVTRELEPSSLAELLPVVPTLDRTPPGASAVSPFASDVAASDVESAFKAVWGQDVGKHIAISEDENPARCRVDIAAPGYIFHMKLQDFFSRFKIRE